MSSQLSIIEIKRTPHLLMIKTMILFLFYFLPIYNLCKHHFLCCSPYPIHLPYPKLRLFCLQRFRNSLLFCHLHYQYLHPLMRFPIYPVQMFIKLPLQHKHLIVRFSMLLEIMLMYGKEASNRKQEIDRQHHTIPNKRTKDKHYGNVHNRLWNHG